MPAGSASERPPQKNARLCSVRALRVENTRLRFVLSLRVTDGMPEAAFRPSLERHPGAKRTAKYRFFGTFGQPNPSHPLNAPVGIAFTVIGKRELDPEGPGGSPGPLFATIHGMILTGVFRYDSGTSGDGRKNVTSK